MPAVVVRALLVAVALFAVPALLLGGAAAWAQEPKGWLGIEVENITREEADKLGWEGSRGAKVTALRADSPAEKAGLKPGDIIVSVDGVEVESGAALERSIEAKRGGAEISLRVLSGGRERRVALSAPERPAGRTQAAATDGATPQLKLDTGGHMGLVRSVIFTRDGRHIVSGSDDKVIRIWDWQAGKTVRTIRGHVGPGHDGKVFAVALSPDERWLASGGWSDPNGSKPPCCGQIRLYDFAKGELVTLLRGHPEVLNALAWSPDGTRLLSGQGGDNAFGGLWDVERPQAAKALYALRGHKDRIYSVAFTSDSARAVTANYDGKLKLWSVDSGREIATLSGHRAKVRSVTVSPADGTIASGSYDGEIRLWDGRTGRALRVLANNRGGSVGALAFTPDGRWLVATCIDNCGNKYGGRVFEVASGRELASNQEHDNIVAAVGIHPDGRLAATGGFNGEMRIWDLQTGETKHLLKSTGEPLWGVGFSADGRRIAWGTTVKVDQDGFGTLEYQLRLPDGRQGLGRPERLDEAGAKGFARATRTHGAYAIGAGEGGRFAQFGGDGLLLIAKGNRVQGSVSRGPHNGYQHRSYTFSTDGQTVISGGDGGVLSSYDLRGQSLGDFVGHEGEVWAVAPSPDGRFLLSGSGDQTMRLWNIATRELIVTLFRGTDGEWVMWTPQGYYTGSPGADKIVGWQINKGRDKSADYVGAEQLRQHLNRPDIVEKAIVLASAEQAVREAPGTSFKLADLLARPVPRFRITSPAAGSNERSGRAQVKIAVETTSDAIKAIRLQVNGRQVEELTPPVGSGGFQAGEYAFDVPLAKGRNEVRITLTNAIGEKAETLTLLHDGDGDLDKRGTLYLIAIGVDEYKGLGNTCGRDGNASCDLRFSGADARKFVEAIERRVGSAHARIVKRTLVNGAGAKDAPTAANVLDAIDLLKQAKETDTVVLFIAGHGVNEGANYRFLPTNAEIAGGSLRGSTVVSWQILQEAIETAKGRRVLFVDTCHSGNAYNQRLGNAAYHANIIAYTAARFDQEAMEDKRLGHGIFTYAVVEGLDGKGELAARRQISTKELADYVVKRVDQLAKALQGEQEPQYFKGRDAEDYVLARW